MEDVRPAVDPRLQCCTRNCSYGVTESYYGERIAGTAARYTIRTVHHANSLPGPITAETASQQASSRAKLHSRCFRSLGRVPDSSRSVCTGLRKRPCEIQLIGFVGINGLRRTASRTTRSSAEIKGNTLHCILLITPINEWY